MKLYICEKPRQGRDLARNLGISGGSNGFIGDKDIVVTWAIGHLIQQLEPDEIDAKYQKWNLEDLPIVPEVWKMKPNPNTKKQLNTIKNLLKQANHVVIATDGDMEGEVIGRELLDYFGWSGTIERLWLTALDDKSIQKALSAIKADAETKLLYDAGRARARADWLVGMSATRALTVTAKKQGYSGVLSVGRVQTPTLAIVVNRDLDIENFKSKDYYDLMGVFSGVEAKWRTPKDDDTHGLFDEEGRCLNLDYVTQTANKVKNSAASVIKFETQRKKVSQPLLYSLSALQQAANKKFGFGVKQVLDLAQSLYEKHKATTYPRSKCQYLPTSQLSEVKDVMSVIQNINTDMTNIVNAVDFSIKSKVWNDKKLSAHHAIIPTANTQIDVSRMTTDECKIYDLICRSYVAQFYPNYEYDKTDIEISAADEVFTSSINVDVVLGWKVVVTNQTDLKKNNIPKITQGQQLNVDEVDIQTKQTKPPARYIEGTLIAAMEKAHLFVTDPNLKKVLKGTEGIGTEATRADIIDLLKKRNFVTIKKQYIISSPLGRLLIATVPNEVKDPGMTAIMEGSLSKIASGELKINAFMDWQIVWLRKTIELVQAQTISFDSNIKTTKCPKCGENMFLRKSKKGQFWGCSGYPDCKTTAAHQNGNAVFEADMPDCPKCGKKLRRVKGKKGFFWSCKGYFETPKCEFTAKDKGGKPDFNEVKNNDIQ